MLTKPVFSLKDLLDFDPRKLSENSAEAPLTPEQLAQSSVNPEPQEISPIPTPTVKAPPVSRVKEAFQATQTPEQKQAAQEAADAKNPLIDTEMQQALETARQNRATNERRQALFEMMGGLASIGGMKISPESKALESAIKTQNAPIEDISAKRTQERQFLLNKEELEKADPTSPVSRTMRDALSGMGVKIPENASYATMEKLAPQLMRNKEFQMRLEEMQLRRGEIAAEKERLSKEKQDIRSQDRLVRARESILRSERYKTLTESTTALKAARTNLELAKKGHSQAYSALGANLAKLAGEKGMLSEADVNRYLVEKGIPGKIEQGIFLSTGKPTANQIKNLDSILTSLESDVKDRGAQFAANELSGYSYGLKVDPAEVESILPELKNLKGTTKSISQQSVIVTPDGQEIPMASRQAAERFKQDHPEVKIKGE